MSKGRKILVYGGSGGIGSAIAKRLHQRGCSLHLTGRNAEKLSAVASNLGAGFTAGDVFEEDFFKRVTNDAGDALGGLVYAVGTIQLRALQSLSADDFLNDFQVNALGAALAVKTALPALKKTEGTASVVFFSSVAAIQGFSLHASMGMAKGAVSGLTLSLAAELAPKVRVNAIAPSLTQTPLAKGILASEPMAKSIAAMHALERLGTPEDIAILAEFLLSPEAGWITGQILSVDGGRSTLRTKG